jgi:hypothetical protein
MRTIDDSAANHLDLRRAYFDGSLQLLRELAVTINLDAALPRLSASARKMRRHDALRMAGFDQRGPLIVNASTADVPDMTVSEREELIIDDRRSDTVGAVRLAPDRAAGRRRLPFGSRPVDPRA